jgi:UDP-N-acetylmuramate--alanine ligase
VVGARIAQLGRSAAWGGGGPLVVEADESDGTFLSWARHRGGDQRRADHLETGVARPPAQGRLPPGSVWAAGLRAVRGRRGLAAAGRGRGTPLTYGPPSADYRVADPAPAGSGVRFTVEPRRADRGGGAAARSPNARNHRRWPATTLGVPLARVRPWRGSPASRRSSPGEAGGVTVVDSYDPCHRGGGALAAAAWGPWARVVAVFQPHRYSRTRRCGATSRTLTDADVLAVTGVYAAGEAPRSGVTGKLVVDAVLDAPLGSGLASEPDDVELWLSSVLRPGDLCLTLGRGPTSLPPRIVAMLEARA